MESAESFGFDVVSKLYNFAYDIVRIDDLIINISAPIFPKLSFRYKVWGQLWWKLSVKTKQILENILEAAFLIIW